jgi:hypothetical protein
MNKVALVTPHETYAALCAVADGRKATVRVDREALSKLLVDHAAMSRALRDLNRLTEPVAQIKGRTRLQTKP